MLKAGRKTVRQFLREHFGIVTGAWEYWRRENWMPDRADLQEFLRAVRAARLRLHGRLKRRLFIVQQLKLCVPKNDAVDVREERQEIVFSHRRVTGMSALTTKIKAASRPRVLVAVDQLHALDYPKNVGVKYLAQFANG